MKIRALLTLILFSSLPRLLLHRGHLSPRSCPAPRPPSCPSILPPFKTEPVYRLLALTSASESPVKGPSLLPLSSRERTGAQMGRGDRTEASSPSLAPGQTSTRLGRAEGVHPCSSTPSFPLKEPPAPRPCPVAWHLVWVLQSWAPGPGLRTCEPQLCVDLFSLGGGA